MQAKKNRMTRLRMAATATLLGALTLGWTAASAARTNGPRATKGTVEDRLQMGERVEGDQQRGRRSRLRLPCAGRFEAIYM